MSLRNHTTITKNVNFFEELYEQYYSSMIKFASAFLYDESDAKDVVQEVFFELWERTSELNLKSSIKTYLFSCVKYKCYKKIKQYNIIDYNYDFVKEAILISENSVEELNDELKMEIKSIINSLPSQMRLILQLYCFEGYKYKEISEELSITINTVKTQIKRGYKRFRKELNKEHFYSLLFYFIKKN